MPPSELGGQDAKIIVFKGIEENGKKKIPTMNDKCAGGTGGVFAETDINSLQKQGTLTFEC